MNAKRRTDYKRAADRAAPTPTPARPATPAARPPDITPKRITLDLPPDLYHGLGRWCNTAAVDMGRTRVTKADAMRALIGALLEDSDVAGNVQRRLEAGA